MKSLSYLSIGTVVLLEMNKEKLEILAKERGNVIVKILKSKHSELYKAVEKEEGRSFAEKLYKYLYGEYKGCKVCGKPTYFLTFNKGYNTYCSNKCSSEDNKEIRAASIKNSFQRKYGVNSPSQLESTKEKVKQRREEGAYQQVVSKRKRTLEKKYGSSTYNNLEKAKKTKKRKYGDENYNNRAKHFKTLEERYGCRIHPNSLQKLKERLERGEVGTSSQKYREWLQLKGITNISQDSTVKDINKAQKQERTYKVLLERIKIYVEPLFSLDGFKGLGTYGTVYSFRCKKCGTEFEDYIHSTHIPRCTNCYPRKKYTSIAQYEIYNLIKEIIPEEEIELNNRTVLEQKELDILIPSRNLAIEYNGNFWHSEVQGGKTKEYHLEKTVECSKKGIHLLQIFEDEWLYNRHIVESKIRHILGASKEKVYARKCRVTEITSKQSNSFLKNHHLQGGDRSPIRLGLWEENRLVAVMTFSRLRAALGSKSSPTGEYEMVRYCVGEKPVVGGAGKLFKYFKQEHNPAKVITFADRRWSSSDNLYKTLNFKKTSEGVPNYWYLEKKTFKRLHRFGFRKSVLGSKLKEFDSSLTEWQNMQLNGYDRIWDCGSFRYEWEP